MCRVSWGVDGRRRVGWRQPANGALQYTVVANLSAVILVVFFFFFCLFATTIQQLQGKGAFLLACASDPMCTCSLSSNALGLWAGLPFRVQVDARRFHAPQLAVHLEAFNNRARSAPPSPPYRPAHPPRCFASHLPSPSPLFLGTHTLASTLTPPPTLETTSGTAVHLRAAQRVRSPVRARRARAEAPRAGGAGGGVRAAATGVRCRGVPAAQLQAVDILPASGDRRAAD